MWERSINWLPPKCALTGDQTCNWGMCPDGKANPQPFGVQDNAPTNWATGPGHDDLNVDLWHLFLSWMSVITQFPSLHLFLDPSQLLKPHVNWVSLTFYFSYRYCPPLIHSCKRVIQDSAFSLSLGPLHSTLSRFLECHLSSPSSVLPLLQGSTLTDCRLN